MVKHGWPWFNNYTKQGYSYYINYGKTMIRHDFNPVLWDVHIVLCMQTYWDLRCVPVLLMQWTVLMQIDQC